MKRIVITFLYIFLTIYLSVFFVDSSFCQTTATPTPIDYNLKQMLPTSPEAALLARFGDIPIGYYTGTADISIPLYTIKEAGLDIPITLSYHSSGIKVEDQASDVGLGWLLEPGGSIIQIVNGVADASDTFVTSDAPDYNYLKSHLSIIGFQTLRGQIGTASYLCTLAQPTPGDSQQEMYSLGQGLGQPDIYQYSFPGGYSGKFFIDPETHLIELIDKKQKVFFEQATSGSGWIATTLDGNKYYFNAQESSNDGTTGHTGHTWKLSKIILQNGKEIDFSYTSGGYTWDTYSESYHTEYPIGLYNNGTDAPLMTPTEEFVVTNGSGTTSTTQTISQIKTPDVIVNFNQGTRTDLQMPSITSVDILSSITNTKIKTVNFNLGYFAYSQVGGTASANQTTANLFGQRLKLISVQETGYDQQGNAITNPPYQFTYNESVILPLKNSYAKDYWGYFNNVNNSKLMPDLSYFYDDNQFISYFPYAILTRVQGANRAPDASQMTGNMLTKIVYPTGGNTQFTYQPNQFTNYDYPDVSKLQSTLTSFNVEDENDATNTTTATFAPPRTLTFPITVSFGKGNPNNTVTFSQMTAAFVAVKEIKNGVTTTIKQWQMSATDQTAFNAGAVIINDTCRILYDAAAQYQLIASIPDNLGDQNSSTAGANANAYMSYYAIPVTTTPVSYGGGVRVASIQNYDNTGALISNKIINYVNDDGTCSGILMSPLSFQNNRYMHFEFCYHPDPSKPDVEFNYANAETWWLSSESQVPFSTGAAGNMVGYSRVEEVELANNNPTNGKHVYYYHNQPSQTMYATPDNPDLLNGAVTQENIYDNSGNELLSTSYNYTSLLDSTFMAYKNFYNMLANFTCSAPGLYYSIPNPFQLYTIITYPINSHWYMLTSKTVTHYDGPTPLATTTSYTYNAMGQLSQQSVVNSRNETIADSYIYPFDESQKTSIQQSLIDSAFYNDILEHHSFNNGVETSQAKVSYNIINSQLVRSEIDRSYNGNALFTDVTFDAYGPNKILLQASEKAIQPSAFLYDYTNSQLIADVKNADIVDVAYTSFEPNQPGNWTIPSTSRNPSGISGSFSYDLANGPISKSGLTGSETYIFSFWTTSSTALTVAGTLTGYPIKGNTVNGWTFYQYLIKNESTVSLSGSGLIDEVRLYPAVAQMTTYTYAPLVGITTSIDAKNDITYYEYDGLQRLINIKDANGNIVKHMAYHYQGQ